MEYPPLNPIFAAETEPIVGAIDNQTLILQMRPNFILGLVILDDVPVDQRVLRRDDNRCSHFAPGYQLLGSSLILEWLFDAIILDKIPGEQQFLGLAVRWQTYIDHIDTCVLRELVILDGHLAVQPIQQLVQPIPDENGAVGVLGKGVELDDHLGIDQGCHFHSQLAILDEIIVANLHGHPVRLVPPAGLDLDAVAGAVVEPITCIENKLEHWLVWQNAIG